MTRVRTREWSSTDYYAVLGVPSDATPAEVDLTYRELAKSLHPDRNPDLDDQERFKHVSAAYSALRDPATRAAYDDFRSRVADGTLYVPLDRRPNPPPASRVDHLAPPRVPKTRRPMPTWLRRVIAGILALAGVAAAVWATVGNLPSRTDADTPIAVQVTLVIMAIKFVACGAAVAWYPQLRARWHH